MRIPGTSASPFSRDGSRAVAFGIAGVLVVVALELTESGRESFLPPGALDTVVDVLLATVGLVCSGIGAHAIAGRPLVGVLGPGRREDAARSARRVTRGVLARRGPDEMSVGELVEMDLHGASDPHVRQAVVDRCCAHLRSCSLEAPPSTWSAGEDAAARERLLVRQAAQNLITRHLRPHGPGSADAHWPEVAVVDLEGAVLLDLDLRDCRVARIRLPGATVHGTAALDRARFDREAGFDATTFAGPATFDGATFSGDAAFFGARFLDAASFDGARFEHPAWFHGAVFVGSASFRATLFAGPAEFVESEFERDVDLTGARARHRDRHALPPGWSVGGHDARGWVGFLRTGGSPGGR